MEKDYEVRAYQPGGEEEIVRLLELVWGRWPGFDIECSPLEHWRWKYQNNSPRMNQIAVGVNNNRIIGCDHARLLKVKIGNGIFLCAHEVDEAVHHDFRGMGISRRMKELEMGLRKGAGVYLSFFETENPILIKRVSRIAHRFPRALRHFMRIQDIDLHLRKNPRRNAWIKKHGLGPVKWVNKIMSDLTLSDPAQRDFHIQTIHHFNDRIDLFWEGIKAYYDFIIERRRDYLNWRYLDRRGGNYIVKVAEKEGKILGFMVLKIKEPEKDYPFGYIIDLLTLPHRLDAADALVADGVHHFTNSNVNVIYCLMVKGHPYERILKKNGFLSRGEQEFFYKEYEKFEELGRFERASASGLYFAYGDLDFV